MASKTCPSEPLVFDSGSGNYWLKVKDRFMELGSRDTNLHLRNSGLSKEEYVGALNQLEHAQWLAQSERAVEYAGPLAGGRLGVHSMPDGRLVLVTRHVSPVPAKRGDTARLDAFLGELLGDQTQHLLWQWKLSRESLLAADYRPAQCLCFCGPAGCGKSLLQQLYTVWLGGRVAKPYRYMMGETAFNGDLAEAEHWTIEDEDSSTDMRSRRKFGAALKGATVNHRLSVHRKGRQAVTLPVFRRVTLSTNDEPEAIVVIPPLDDSIADKLSLYKCGVANVDSNREREWKALTACLPGLAWTLDKIKIPKDWRCPRYGVRAWHHPELVESLSAMAPEVRLLSLIDEVLFPDSGPQPPWKGSAEALEKQLLSSSFNFAVARLLYYSTACGVYLSRLLGKYPRRLAATREGKERSKVWTIQPPQ